MADVHEPHIRNHNMSQIKRKNTKPAILVRNLKFEKAGTPNTPSDSVDQMT